MKGAFKNFFKASIFLKKQFFPKLIKELVARRKSSESLDSHSVPPFPAESRLFLNHMIRYNMRGCFSSAPPIAGKCPHQKRLRHENITSYRSLLMSLSGLSRPPLPSPRRGPCSARVHRRPAHSRRSRRPRPCSRPLPACAPSTSP